MDNIVQNEQPFFYKVTTTLAGGQQGQVALVLDSDSQFLLYCFEGTSDLDQATDFSPNNFTVNIQLTTGRFIANQPISQRLICTPSNTGLLEGRPIRFNPSDQLNFIFQNLSGNQSNTIEFVMKGYKLFV